MTRKLTGFIKQLYENSLLHSFYLLFRGGIA